MKTLFFALPLLALSATVAEARGVANDMTCSQAQAHYNANGRIMVRTSYGDVIPIYGLRRYCSGGETSSPYFVRTRDGQRCLLGYRCYPYSP